ncbi:MAG: hypothetical protein GX444_16655 [Myxococcales bacterium]|nr:hypothetical protein [Myxococcales bacterium]
MNRNFWAVLILIAFLGLTGCNSIEDMIQEATQQTVSVSRTISNTTSERDIQSVTVVEGVNVAGGQAIPAGVAKVEKLADRIEVTRLGMAEVRFFVKAYVENNSKLAAFVTLYAIPNAEGIGEPMPIGNITLAPFEKREVVNPGDMDEGADTIHENLKAIFLALGDDYELSPIIQVQGSNSQGVTADFVQLSAQPVLWDSDLMSPGSLPSFKKNVKRVYDAKLEGSITNYGANVAEVKIYLTIDPEAPLEDTLLARAFLAPGETLAGYEIEVEGGGHMIKNAFESMIEGQKLVQDFVVLSEDPFSVKCRNLRLHAKLVVEADIF